MILVVGHGPSSQVDPKWVDDQEFVVRCFTGTINSGKGQFVPHVGRKTDVIVTPTPKRMYSGPVWWLIGDYLEQLREIADPLTDKKLSTGTSACLIAHLLYPDKELGVIGFDTTLREYRIDETGFWPYHDARAEGELLRNIGVKDYGKDV